MLDRTLRIVGFELIFHDGVAGSQTWQGELNSDRHPAYLSVTPEYLVDCWIRATSAPCSRAWGEPTGALLARLGRLRTRELVLAPQGGGGDRASRGCRRQGARQDDRLRARRLRHPALAGRARNALTIAYSDAVQWADALL